MAQEKKEKKSNIFLFHGSDIYSSSEKVRQWISHFEKKYSHGATVIDGNSLSPELLYETLRHAFRSNSLFSPIRLIVAKRILCFPKMSEETKRLIAEEFGRTAESRFIVFLEETLDMRMALCKQCIQFQKSGKINIEEFSMPSDGYLLERWISNVAKNLKVSLQENALRALILALSPIREKQQFDSAPPDPWRIVNELKKLAAYANGAPITQEMVDALSAQYPTAHLFRFGNALVQKNKKEAHINAQLLLSVQSTSLIGIMQFLQNQFRDLLFIRCALDDGMSEVKLGTILGWHAKRIWVVRRNLGYWRRDELVDFYRLLAAIEQRSKSSPPHAPLFLDRLIASVPANVPMR